MIKRFISITLIVLFFLGFMSCDRGGSKDTKINAVETNKEDREEKIDKLIKSMTIDEKVGQLFIVAFQGKVVNNEIKDLIEKYKVSGVILFSGNISDKENTKYLIKDLKAINEKNKYPLFISVDEEGGRVTRMPNDIEKTPASSVVGKRNDVDFAREVGNTIGKNLKFLGYNMNFAPVLDIFSNPKNTVIGDRAFGSDIDIVIKMSNSEIRGLKENNIIVVPKHFPGHGDTEVDSHVGLPIVNKSLDELKAFEFKPFESAINNGIEAIMVSHIILSKIDKENPATLSKDVINILKNDLNFDGVIVSDDMTMGAITSNYNLPDAVTKSINAGVDLVLVCNGIENQANSINKVKESISNGAIKEERLNDAVRKILRLKLKYEI